MTYKISIEALGQLSPDGFARHVAERIATLKEYDAHEAIVRQHAANPDMPDEERYTTLAVPAASVEVDSAIRRTLRDDGTTDFIADYKFVGPSFEVRKSRLFDAVSTAEREAIATVAPAGKLRTYQFREQDIRAADQARVNEHLKAVNRGEDGGFAALPAAFVEMTRSREDTKFLAEQTARETKRQAIYRWAAALHSDIEDLTPETIDAWEMKPFQ